MTRSRTIRWVLLIAAHRRRRAISAGSALRRTNSLAGRKRAKALPRPHRRPGQDRAGRKGRLSGLSDRARHRAGLQHRAGAHPGRRPDRQDRLQGRPVGQARRYAGRDRPAAVPGGARSGHGQEGAGRSQPCQRQSRPAALHQARRIRHAAADRHPAFHGRAADRADRRPTRPRSTTRRPSSTTPPSRRRSRASWAFVRSTSATSSMPPPRPASSPSPRSSRSR